jgi:phage FluMu protein Com
MIEKKICPYCDELVDMEFSDDYYMTEQGKVFDEVDCPKCKKRIQFDWEICHTIYARRKE